MRKAVLVDSSAVLALLDANDANHVSAVAVATRIQTERRAWFVTNYVEAETHALLLKKLGRAAAREWLLAGGMPVVRASSDEEAMGRELIARHQDKEWSLCDAISFAGAERRSAVAFSFDRHFVQYGRLEVWGCPLPGG
ncbi:MAG: type II toxin-antitoxin system VapC family toxin [Myxococcales bacterium]|nr:type II toxin-antitoxin system VapC family toxin [Myxococcales bacterium]